MIELYSLISMTRYDPNPTRDFRTDNFLHESNTKLASQGYEV
jgi:hypothetical protein